MFSFSQLNEKPVMKRFVKLSDLTQNELFTISSVTKKYSIKLEKNVVDLEFYDALNQLTCVTLPVRFSNFSQPDLDKLVGKTFTYKGKTNEGIHDLYFFE